MKKALIVAAGLSTRLRSLPLSEGIPKAVVEVGGVPLIKRSVDTLLSYGIDDITVVVGYGQEHVRQLLGGSVSYVVNHDYSATNNMVSLLLGRQAMEGHSFLYLHADLWYHPAIIGIAVHHPEKIVFLVEKKLCGAEEMKVRVENGLLVEADKFIPPDEALGEWLGIIKFEPSGASLYFDEAEKTLLHSRMLYDCAVVRELAARGTAVHYVDIGNLPWVEIDFAKDLEYANALANQET